MEYSPS